MNENMELMMHVYETSEMGVYSTKTLLKSLKNKENKIKHVLEMELKEYEKFMKISKKILLSNKIEPKDTSLMTKMGSSIGISMETMMDNSDSAISSMLIEGLTMGITEMENKLEQYKKVCEKKYTKICKDFIEFNENEIAKLKEFL